MDKEQRECATPTHAGDEGDCGHCRHQIRGGGAPEPFDSLGKGQVAAVTALGADVAHDRVARDLEEGGPNAEQEDAGQEHREARGLERGDQAGDRVQAQAQQQELLLADPGRQQPARHAEHGEGDEDKEGHQRGNELADVIFLSHSVGHRSHGVGQAHEEEGEKDR